MASNKINTVVAKAIIHQLVKAANEERQAKTVVIKKQLDSSPESKALAKKYDQLKKLNSEIQTLQQSILKSAPKGFNASLSYRDKTFDVSYDRVYYDETCLVSEIILMAHKGMSVDAITVAIGKKLK